MGDAARRVVAGRYPSTVENSLQLVAMALTDAQPSSMGSQEGEDGDGEGGDEKDK